MFVIVRLVQCSCAGLRQVCAPARTGSKGQYRHFRRNLSAQVPSYADAAPGTSLFSGVTTTWHPRRGFSTCWIFACVDRLSQPTAIEATGGRADTASAVYCRALFARKVRLVHCVTYIAQTTNMRLLRRRLDASVDELMPSATMLRLRRWQWPHCGDVML